MSRSTGTKQGFVDCARMQKRKQKMTASQDSRAKERECGSACETEAMHTGRVKRSYAGKAKH